MKFEYFIPTKMYFGAGELKRLADIKLPGTKALIVISSGKSVKTNGHLDRAIGYLKENDVDAVVFDKIKSNPLVEHTMEAALTANENGCDFIIGLGGGSAIDSAKSIAVMATNPGHYWDYITGGSGKGKPLVNQPLPVIAVTTTAGTGTEIDPFTVQTNGQEKIGFGVPGTFPKIAIVDPELMLTVPPLLTAYQGFDALFHASEGYLSTMATPVSEILSLKAIALINQSLPTAVKNGNDIKARTDVALANSLAGMVESMSKMTSHHSMSHAISALYPEIAHGQALTMLSIAFFGFFAEKENARTSAIAKAMGQPNGDIVAALTSLQQRCGVYEMKMSKYGVKREAIPIMVENAYDTMGRLFAFDRYQLSRDDVLAIFYKSYR